MKNVTEPNYQDMVEEFKRLASESQTTNRARLLELRDLLEQHEAEEGLEPPLPKSLPDRLEVEMYKMRMSQKDFANFLGITPTRLSEVMNGKRQPNLDLVKRLHTALLIPGDELLELV
jgi:HTH-type transcriptional regulator/antitoxin HigA